MRACMRRVAAACLAALLAPSSATAASEVPGASPAEQLVFLRAHLAELKPPLALRYAYTRETEGEAPLHDHMRLTLERAAGGGCCAVKGRFLSGERAMTLPEIDDASANPMLLYYLEHEVRELSRLTKGQSAFFRKRIRQAFVDAATIAPVTIRWDGRDLAAQEVRITPFRDDPQRARFERQARKEYAFVLSDAVPGGVYRIHTLIPAAEAGSAPLQRETLTLEPLEAPANPRK